MTDRLLTAEELHRLTDDAYLTASELHALTGRKQRPAQVQWLRDNRWRFAVDADGGARVLRDYWRRKLLDDAPIVSARIEPDFGAVRELRAKRVA
jgi:Domain of unknown function (DUF4224)